MKSKLPAALIPAAAVAALAVLAAGTTFGWADALWLAWGLIFALFEGNAILNETSGDTLSERLRVWFRTKTPAGRLGFGLVITTLCAWLIPHILLG